jgi:hypothetical protein
VGSGLARDSAAGYRAHPRRILNAKGRSHSAFFEGGGGGVGGRAYGGDGFVFTYLSDTLAGGTRIGGSICRLVILNLGRFRELGK